MSDDPDAVARASIQEWVLATKDDETAELPADWPLAVWAVLVRDFPDLRYWAAHSRNTPEAIVRVLACDDDWRVRSRVAQKRSLPRDLFDLMERDPSEVVRQRLASNAKAPLEIVERLTRDPVDNVARIAAYNLRERRAKHDKKRP